MKIAQTHINQQGFSMILAIVVVAFLVVVATGIFDLYLREYKINATYVRGTKNHIGAEAALEYGLLKVKNHKEGFLDTISSDTPQEHQLLVSGKNRADDMKISYEMQNSGTSYSGTLSASGFEIIPLFYDKWQKLGDIDINKNPNPNTSTIQPVLSFQFHSSAQVAFNLVGNDEAGATYGLAGLSNSFGTDGGVSLVSATLKTLSGKDFVFEEKQIKAFLEEYNNGSRSQTYLLLFNPTSSPISYSLESSTPFAFPKVHIVASAKIQDSQQNLLFEQSQSRLFESLQFSIFR